MKDISEQEKIERERQAELAAIEREEERVLKELERLGATEEEKLKIKQKYQDLEAGIKDKHRKEDEEAEEIVENTKFEMAKQTLGNISHCYG